MKIRKSNNDTLEEAYNILRKRLSSVASSCNISQEEAEDLIQEGYLRLSDKAILSKEEAKGKFWVTVRNLAIDRFRRKRFETTLNYEPYDREYNDFNYSDHERIMKQMRHILSPLQYQIMTMLIVDELEYSEIAKNLNMKEGAVRTAVSRTRKILKEKLER